MAGKTKITIIGAGLSGCFMAILLAKRGYSVDIYEKYSRSQIINKSSDRSFNLTFYKYGVQILKQEGLWKDLKSVFIPLSGSITQVGINNKTVYTKYNKNTPYYTVQRATLLEALINKVKQHPSIKIQFNNNLIHINKREKVIYLENNRSRKIKKLPYEVLIGADGVHSQVRSYLQQFEDIKHYQEYEKWEYKQIHLSKENAKLCGLSKKVMYAWTNHKSILTALPNKDGTYTAMLILPNNKFEKLLSTSPLDKYISVNFPNFLPVLHDLRRQILNNTAGKFFTLQTSPWFYKNQIVLIGDSAHGFLPFFGQGVSCSFGDCVKLISLIEEYNSEWKKIFSLYQKDRKEQTDIIALLSKISFERYKRQKRANYSIIYNKFESVLHTLFPSIFSQPPLESVAKEPDKASLHLKKYKKQRFMTNIFGVPLVAACITLVLMCTERLRVDSNPAPNYLRNFKHRRDD